jgi:predicted Rossmann-fold nucleotide-binding protein
MKFEVDHPSKLEDWLRAPRAAIFQGQDLIAHSAIIAKQNLEGCAFLGCKMNVVLERAAADAGCLLIPTLPGLPFNPFAPALYSPGQLFDQFDPEDADSHRRCLDWIVYESYIDPDTKHLRRADLDLMLMRRLHDASIADALNDLLDLDTRLRTVAIMGGHDVPRTAPLFKQVTHMALDLVNHGFLVLTGGGPGLMEAANLGAYAAGFPDPNEVIDTAIETLSTAPDYHHPGWLRAAFIAWKHMGTPQDPERCRNIGIPTWFYGHEPPNVFATDIAKYFENSAREEGLLAVALAGVIFAPGNAGTVQEIFQDACQNYYRTYDQRKSPMVLLGAGYWNPLDALPGPRTPSRAKQAYPLLLELAREKGFADYLLLTDDSTQIPAFLKSHPPV